MKYALGIDLGGTKIQALAVTPSGRVLADVLMPTGDDGTRSWTMNVQLAKERICDAVKEAPTWIGMDAPGLAARNQQSIRCMPQRLKGLEGLVWRKFLKAAHPVPVLNDAHAALLGEAWRGAARGARNAILLTLGTGVGGAALVEGRLLRGHIGRAGHFGHISLNPDGPRDICNTPGSLEDAIGECTIKARTLGRFDSAKALIAASNKKDAGARAIWLKSVQRLAAATRIIDQRARP